MKKIAAQKKERTNSKTFQQRAKLLVIQWDDKRSFNCLLYLLDVLPLHRELDERYNTVPPVEIKLQNALHRGVFPFEILHGYSFFADNHGTI